MILDDLDHLINFYVGDVGSNGITYYFNIDSNAYMSVTAFFLLRVLENLIVLISI